MGTAVTATVVGKDWQGATYECPRYIGLSAPPWFEAQAAAGVRKTEEAMRLVPRTAADELPPDRGQPWIIDKQGYRKVDPSLTLVPMSRL
jgi:hypothetical protein